MFKKFKKNAPLTNFLLGIAFVFIVIILLFFVFIYFIFNYNWLGSPPNSKFYDGISNKNGETKNIYEENEEVYGTQLSIKIINSKRSIKPDSLDNLKIKAKVLNETEINSKSITLCSVEYKITNWYNYTDGRFLEPIGVLNEQNNLEATSFGTYWPNNSRNTNTMNKIGDFKTAEHFFACDQNSNSYILKINPCHLRTGCLDGGEFFSSEADSWRINKEIYKTYAEYIAPVKIKFKIK